MVPPQVLSRMLSFVHPLLPLQHRTERVVFEGDRLTRAATVFVIGFAMTERETHEEALAHFIFAIGHALECLLLVMHFFVLSHISFTGEVVEVSGVCLRVQLGHEWRLGLSENIPFHLREVLVLVDVLDGREPPRA